jgi:hypothetical protein
MNGCAHAFPICVLASHRVTKCTVKPPNELLIEWPKGQADPTKYWLRCATQKSSLTRPANLMKRDFRLGLEVSRRPFLGVRPGRLRGAHARVCG